jgi:serine protease Do
MIFVNLAPHSPACRGKESGKYDLAAAQPSLENSLLFVYQAVGMNKEEDRMHWRMSHGHYTTGFAWIVILVLGLGPQAARANDETAEEADAYHHAKALSLAFRNAAKKVLPTVVTIETKTKLAPLERGPLGRGPFPGAPSEDLFEEQTPGLEERSQPRGSLPNLGSGVIIDPAGIVLTNHHVVSGADEVVVLLSDGRRLKATEIKMDDKSDLAVVRIDSQEPLPVAKLADSDKLEIGDWVLAIGSPYDLERTVSAGIISAKGRSLGTLGRNNYLQTDAAINPGSSGGPLVNLEGEIVGINTAIFSRSGGNQGIGFAIPSNVARWAVPQLIKTGTVRRAYLGVSLAPLTSQRAAKLGVSPRQGVLVDKVFPDTPAAAAGLRDNDLLATFDGKPLHDATDLQQAVERAEIKSQHRLDILRDGKPLAMQVTVEEMPKDYATVPGGPATNGEDRLYRDTTLGLMVGDLPPPMANQLGIQAGSGVLVLQVEPRSIAHRAGVRPGMVILKIGQKPVKNAADVKAALEAQALNDGLILQLQTREGPQTVTLKGL